LAPVIYLIRHGEVAHHRSDLNLTPRGREQSKAAGNWLASEVRDRDTIYVFHSPVTRAVETAQVVYDGLLLTLERDGRLARVVLHPPQPDPALHNVRFSLAPGHEPQEPSLLYDEMNLRNCAGQVATSRAEFYRGFWASADPMGYWLTHDSSGGAESPAEVLARLKRRLGGLVLEDGHCPSNRSVYIIITHSGPIRVLLRDALGTDPGEPDFCEIVTLGSSTEPDCVALSYRAAIARVALRVADPIGF
jgi:broad specificity phosphatase PhoE